MIAQLKTNPVVVTLRSIAFEILAALVLRIRGYESVKLGRTVPFEQTMRDIDVYGFREGELFMVECKAYHRHKSIQPDEPTKFFAQCVPALKNWLKHRDFDFERCTAEIWTTGPIGQGAEREFAKLRPSKRDQWRMIGAEKLLRELGPAVRRRATELVRAIALTETEESDATR